MDRYLLKIFMTSVLALALAGCAAGNQYNYRFDTLPLPVSGEGEVGLSVNDERPYVKTGDKPRTFVGLQRGGFGNPFTVKTESGRPLVDDMEESIAAGLSAKGFDVKRLYVLAADKSDIALAAEKEDLRRIITLEVKEWKSDAMARVTLHYDLALRVFDKNGDLLAESSVADVVPVGGARFETGNSQTVGIQFERIMSLLFSSPDIQSALNF